MFYYVTNVVSLLIVFMCDNGRIEGKFVELIFIIGCYYANFTVIAWCIIDYGLIINRVG